MRRERETNLEVWSFLRGEKLVVWTNTNYTKFWTWNKDRGLDGERGERKGGREEGERERGRGWG